jgi:hypothetical protein
VYKRTNSITFANYVPSAAILALAKAHPGKLIRDKLTCFLVRYHNATGNYMLYNPATGARRVFTPSIFQTLTTTDWLLVGGAAAVGVWAIASHGKK